MSDKPEYIAIRQDELTSLQQRLAIAESELERLTGDNAGYLMALRKVSDVALAAINGGAVEVAE